MKGWHVRMGFLSLAVAALAMLSGCAGRSQSPVTADPASVYRVAGPLVNLLSCPSVTCSVVEDLRQGQQVAVKAACPGGWLEVRTRASGREGYVLGRFLTKP